jgi:transcription elongation factor Elf1
MPYKDPEKRKEYRREWYSKNKESERAHIQRRKKEIKKWVSKYKSKLKCSKCEENHPATMDFHHKGKKDQQISKMVNDGYSVNRIKKEMEKCEILCANCHRKLHWKNNKP